MTMKILTFITIPLISALIGWITNYIAVKMIFRPRREINILGIRIIGLIPKRKSLLADKIAQTVENELISHRDIMNIMKSEDFHSQLGSVLKTKIEGFITSKVSSNSLLAMFVTPDTVSRLSALLMEELETELPGIMDEMFKKVESKLDFHTIIRDKIMGFDLAKLESIIYDIASKELKAIELLGGVLGFAVGLAQLAIILIGELNVL